MRFQFFKSTKVEAKETSKPATASSKSLAATQRIPVPIANNPRLGKPPVPVAAPAVAPASDVPTVTVRMSSLSSQIPPQIFSVQGQAMLASTKVNVPVSVILPQVADGRISIALAELLSYLPTGLLRNPLPPFPEQQAIILPLEEVIMAIPPDLLDGKHELEISADDPELGKLPTLIDAESLAAHRRTRSNRTLADTQPVRRITDDTKPEAKATPPEEVSPLVVPARPRNDLPEYVMVSLSALVMVLPDCIFSCPRNELLGKLKNPEPILLPAEPIIPQLRSGVARLPLSIVVALLPHSILASPMPNLDGMLAPLPLSEIIRQLPPHLFTDHLREPLQQASVDDAEIPDPFHERDAVGATPAPPEPTADLGLDAATLEDESFAIFAEKTPAAPLAPTPEPEAVEAVEPPPAVESQPVETVASATAPVEPIEPVAPVISEPEPVETVPSMPEPVLAAETPAVPEPQPIAETPTISEPTPVDVAPAIPEPAYADADLAEDNEPEAMPVAASVEQSDEAFPVGDQRKFLVDLNRCTVEDLMTIPGIGRALAQRIVEFRNARGHFSSVEELRRVPGIGRKTYRALAGVQPRALNRLLGAPHDGELTLQEVVRLTGQLPGIQGCMLALSDGLFLTGQLPPHLDENTISVFAPQLFKKVGRYARELKVGSIRRFTIFTDTQPLSIFRAGDVYLIIVHDAQHYSKALLRRCERISEEIARLSSQRVTV